MDLLNQLVIKNKELDIAVKSLRKTGEDYANAYSEYRMALSKNY